MGVTIESKNHAIDMGYGGFRMLRIKVAELTVPDIFEHYKKSMDGMRLYDADERKAFYKSYNTKIAELDKKYKGKMFYTAIPAEKTARNLLILKLSLKTVLIPVMVSPGS